MHAPGIRKRPVAGGGEGHFETNQFKCSKQSSRIVPHLLQGIWNCNVQVSETFILVGNGGEDRQGVGQDSERSSHEGCASHGVF